MDIRQKQKGFTLIELMIVVAILGILVAIAYPSYARYVTSSWRSTAQICMLEIAQEMEQRYTTNFAYSLVDEIGANDGAGDGNEDLFQSGCAVEGDMTSRYAFSFSTLTSGAFSILATSQNAQRGDNCHTLTVDAQGSKKAHDKDHKAQQDCW